MCKELNEDGRYRNEIFLEHAMIILCFRPISTATLEPVLARSTAHWDRDPSWQWGNLMHKISFMSQFIFGDVIEWDCRDYGQGRGRIIDIVICDDGAVYYTAQPDDGDAQSGLYPDQIRLVQKATPRHE